MNCRHLQALSTFTWTFINWLHRSAHQEWYIRFLTKELHDISTLSYLYADKTATGINLGFSILPEDTCSPGLGIKAPTPRLVEDPLDLLSSSRPLIKGKKTEWSHILKYNSRIDKIPPTNSCSFSLHPAFLVNTENISPAWELCRFDKNTNIPDICHDRVNVSPIKLNKKMRIPLRLTLPTPQLVSPPFGQEHFSTWLHFRPPFLSLFSSFNSHLLQPRARLHIRRYLLLYLNFSYLFSFISAGVFLFLFFLFFLHYLLDWFSLSTLLIGPLFRSISPNQYLISERSAGLLLYVLWRIVKTHRPSSPLNLFTPKVMKYWIGLRYAEVQPIPYHPHLVHFPQNSGPAIKHLIMFDIRASFFFICFLVSEHWLNPPPFSTQLNIAAKLTSRHVFYMMNEPFALKAYISNHMCCEGPTFK